MANQNFARNLRTICNQHRSVAHVCRSLEMNRQQFNKYLSGQIFPSRHNLQRICQFFKLSQDNLVLDPAEFERLISDIPKADSGQGHIETLLDSIPNAVDALARYEGYYYSHFHALGFPGSMVRSLVQIYRRQDCFYTKTSNIYGTRKKVTQNIIASSTVASPFTSLIVSLLPNTKP